MAHEWAAWLPNPCHPANLHGFGVGSKINTGPQMREWLCDRHREEGSPTLQSGEQNQNWPTKGQIRYLTRAVWAEPNVLERGKKSGVGHIPGGGMGSKTPPSNGRPAPSGLESLWRTPSPCAYHSTSQMIRTMLPARGRVPPRRPPSGVRAIAHPPDLSAEATPPEPSHRRAPPGEPPGHPPPTPWCNPARTPPPPQPPNHSDHRRQRRPMNPLLAAQNPRAFSLRISTTRIEAASPTRRKANQDRHMGATMGLPPGAPHPRLGASCRTQGKR